MKQYGRREKGVQFKSKTDHRIRIKNRKIENWWEDELNSVNKKRERRNSKNRIDEEIK